MAAPAAAPSKASGNTASVGTCKQGDCNVSKDGKCLEGQKSPTLCQYFLAQITPRSGKPARPVRSIAPASEGTINLPTGNDLSIEEASRITRAEPTRAIVLAGAVGSGKTTLAAVLYDLFQRGPFADFNFAGAETLAGFDERCFLSRLDSQRENEDTERTRPEAGLRYLHLRLRRTHLRTPIQSLLLTDLSGEHYDAAKDSVDECRKLGFLRRCDRFVLLLDGKKLVKPEQQSTTLKDTRSLLQIALDADMLGNRSHVEVLFAKWDYIEKAAAEALTLEIETYLRKLFEARLGTLTFHHVAARPKPPSRLDFGHGLAALLQGWLPEPAVAMPPPLRRVEVTSARQADHYLRARLPHLFEESSS